MGSYRLAAPGQVQPFTLSGLTPAAPSVTARTRTLLFADIEHHPPNEPAWSAPGVFYADTVRDGPVRVMVFANHGGPVTYAISLTNTGAGTAVVTRQRSAFKAGTGISAALGLNSGFGALRGWWGGAPATYTLAPGTTRTLLLGSATDRQAGTVLWDADVQGTVRIASLALAGTRASSAAIPVLGGDFRGTLQGADIALSAGFGPGSVLGFGSAGQTDVSVSPPTVVDALTGRSYTLRGHFGLLYTVALQTQGAAFPLVMTDSTQYAGFVQVGGSLLQLGYMVSGQAQPLALVTPAGTLTLGFMVAPGSYTPVRFSAPAGFPSFSAGAARQLGAGTPPPVGVPFDWTPVALIGGVGAAGAAAVVAVEKHRAAG